MKPAKKFRLIIEYLGLKSLVFIIRLMPWNLAVKFGELFGLLLIPAMHKRFKRTKKDIIKAFPEKTKEEAYAIAKESWLNMGRMAAEFVKASQISKEKLSRHIEFRNFEKLKQLNDTGKGAIFHAGHFVNWEVVGLMAGYFFKRISFVARPQSNPYVDKELTKMRTKSGNTMLNAYNPFFSCFKMLKKGYMIGILSDQSAFTDAAFYMNFLNRPAEIAPMTAVLSIKMQVPVVPARATRENGKIIITAEEPIFPPKGPYSQQAVWDLTKILMGKYEDWIRKDPASWLWAHNRWKREKQALEKMQKQENACK